MVHLFTVIRIGFEKGSYTFEEPEFDDEIDQVYLVKQDGVVSEQTFVVVVQFIDTAPLGSNIQPATFDVDYSVSLRPAVLIFQNISQRLLVRFSLFKDNIPEGIEAFLMTSAPGDLGPDVVVPSYLPPITLSADAFVIIEDDSEHTINKKITISCACHFQYSPHTHWI